MPTEASASEPRNTDVPQDERSTRKMLSTSATVPGWLLEHFDIPENCSVHRTVHKDSTLPHVQGKLLGGRFFEGKHLGCSRLSVAVCLLKPSSQ